MMRRQNRLRQGLLYAFCPAVGGQFGYLAKDLSNHGYIGKLIGLDPATDYVYNYGYYGLNFTATNGEGVDVGLNSPFFFQRYNTFSLSAWCYTRTISNPWQYIISHDYNISPAPGWSLSILNNYVFFTIVSNYSNNKIEISGPTNLAINTLYHIVVTYSGITGLSGTNIYVNGIKQSLTLVVNNLTSDVIYNTPGSITRLIVGGSWSTTTTSQPFNGVIYDARVYNRVLDEMDVNMLYSGGPGAGLHPERNRSISLPPVASYKNHLLWPYGLSSAKRTLRPSTRFGPGSNRLMFPGG